MAKRDSLAVAERELKELVLDVKSREKHCKEAKEAHDAMKSQLGVLNENLQMLESEYKRLQPEIEELDKKTSSSRDARKMYGDITPGDTTHQDVVLLYQNYFKTTFHNLPKALSVNKEERYEVWKKTSDMVQRCFEQNKNAFITEMMEELEAALLEPPPTDQPINDKRADLYRAFHMFVTDLVEKEKMKQHQGASNPSDGKPACCLDLEQIKKRALEKLPEKQWNKEDIDLVTDIITQCDPENYYSFIEKRKTHADSHSTATESKDSDKEKFCNGCKKGFQRDVDEVPLCHLGYYWHQHHYYCCICRKVISSTDEMTYIEHVDRMFCSHCLCPQCKEYQPAVQQVLDDKNGYLYHITCVSLKCKRCGSSMTVNENFLMCEKCSPYQK